MYRPIATNGSLPSPEFTNPNPLIYLQSRANLWKSCYVLFFDHRLDEASGCFFQGSQICISQVSALADNLLVLVVSVQISVAAHSFTCEKCRNGTLSELHSFTTLKRKLNTSLARFLLKVHSHAQPSKEMKEKFAL